MLARRGQGASLVWLSYSDDAAFEAGGKMLLALGCPRHQQLEGVQERWQLRVGVDDNAAPMRTVELKLGRRGMQRVRFVDYSKRCGTQSVLRLRDGELVLMAMEGLPPRSQ